MKQNILYIFCIAHLTSCGQDKGSDVSREYKSSAVSKAFLVDMELAPADDARCKIGGVMQKYYYDLNGNGSLDPGEDEGLTPAVDCYSGVVESSNPCENPKTGEKCEIPEAEVSPPLKSCLDANQSQVNSAELILFMNEEGDVKIPENVSCKVLLERIQKVEKIDVFLHFLPEKSKNIDAMDFSILPLLSNVEELVVNGSSKNKKTIKFLSSLKNGPRISKNLRFEILDFKAISFADFLPDKGAEKVELFGTNIAGMEELSKWSFRTNSPITDVRESTIIKSNGPQY